MLFHPVPWRLAAIPLACGLVLAPSVQAQTPPAAAAEPAQPTAPGAAPSPTPAPAPAPARPAAAAAAAPAAPIATERVEVTGGRQTDNEQRRQSTAAKIIIGRDQIEQYGDSSMGELLKRLPGVTTDGRAGRGGGPRMRGLGSGYTQILVDGERVQGGLSLDSIDPEQVERIEILRAPTAETGARAIAGTINIITREGFTRRLNDLKVGAGLERGRLSPGLSWTRDDQWGDLNYNLSLSLFNRRGADASSVRTTSADDPALDYLESRRSTDERTGMHLSGRLRWKLGDGQSLMLMPLLIASRNESEQSSRVTGTGGPYDASQSASDGGFSLLRLNGQWQGVLPDGGRLEVRGGAGQANNRVRLQGLELGDGAGGPGVQTQSENNRSTETTAQLSLKYSTLLADDHSLVAGLELEGAQRDDSRRLLIDGQPQLLDFGDTLSSRTRRLAVYGQDEWTISPQWAAHAGLRWESISTRGEGDSAAAEASRNSVLTPLLHAVYKFEPKGRDQLRMSLTRSYRSPSLQNLLGRPSLSTRYPVPGDNTPTSPDRAGNPALQPELATGLDLALERYLPGGGMLSASLFHRRIQDLMRTVTSLETVSWSSTPRWVARPQNIGAATTQGIELEAKFRLTEFWPEAPALDLRSNASVYRSRVDSVAGPDNRLDQQPGATANLGADYRLPGLPVTVGANLNWTPGYTTRLSENQWLVQGVKRVVDAYALWTVNPQARVRLSANNLGPQDAFSSSEVAGELAQTTAETRVNWRLQLELKL